VGTPLPLRLPRGIPPTPGLRSWSRAAHRRQFLRARPGRPHGVSLTGACVEMILWGAVRAVDTAT